MPAPAFVQRILSTFPLVEYPEDVAIASPDYASTPTKPTLWIYGPGIANERESFDVASLKAQAACAFNRIKVDLKSMQLAEGAPGANLPALHLPDGDLIAAGGISDWIAKQTSSSGQDAKEGYAVENNEKQTQDENVAVQVRTFTTLLESKLQPALLAHFFLHPRTYNELTIPLYFPQTLSHGIAVQPPLTRLAFTALARSYRLEMQAEVAKLTHAGKSLDLEEVQRQGEETIELCAGKLADGGKGWFFGTSAPTSLDALLYAQLHLILTLHAPHLGISSPLRKKLEKQEDLLQWAKRLHKEYFQ